jgi:hypothetical protein
MATDFGVDSRSSLICCSNKCDNFSAKTAAKSSPDFGASFGRASSEFSTGFLKNYNHRFELPSSSIPFFVKTDTNVPLFSI